MTRFRANDPVLVGIGLVSQREEDPAKAREAIELMIDASRQAGQDTTAPSILQRVERIYVPKGRWSYGDPGRAIAHAVGATMAKTVLSDVGVLQQHLIADACERISGGENAAVLVVGGDAGYRMLRAAITSHELNDRRADGEPDEILIPQAALREDAELAVGLQMPVGLYAIIESSLRASRKQSIKVHRDEVAALYVRFSRIASTNPHAWDRSIHELSDIRDPTSKSRMQAFPYTKLQCSSWNVDQASALLLVSARSAQEMEIPRSKWIFPLASAESNTMLSVSSRPILHRSTGARLAGRAALAAAEIAIDEVEYLDLYSCFPSAVQIVASELEIPMSRDLTITGGMPFAGGPYNNYVLHSTGQMANLLRSRHGAKGMVGCISGVITKPAFGIWSADPGIAAFQSIDVSTAVSDKEQPLPVLDVFTGPARIVGCTVLYSPQRSPRAIVVAETEQGARVVAYSEDPAVQQLFETDEMVGNRVMIADKRFELSAAK